MADVASDHMEVLGLKRIRVSGRSKMLTVESLSLHRRNHVRQGRSCGWPDMRNPNNVVPIKRICINDMHQRRVLKKIVS